MMMQPGDFKSHAKPVVDWIGRYLDQLKDLPVKSQVDPGEVYRQIPCEPPEDPAKPEQILEDLQKVILPGMTHWQHPNFHAYFPANHSLESVLAEWITAAMGAQCMIWETSPAAAELEQRVAEWLRDAMGLPEAMEGVIQDTASSATLAALITAREVKTGFISNEEGVPHHLRVYASAETHSSIEKAVGVCGIGRKNLVKIPVDDEMRLDVEELEGKIREDLEKGFLPCAAVATIGTTGTVAVDPLKEIGHICRKYDIWLHVDAAYAGTALLLPEYRWMAEGMEHADSFVFNPHKWMFTNFDCSLYYVRNASQLIRSFEILPEYLKTATRGSVNDYRDWGIPLGRRFRALKLWFVIRSFGLVEIRRRLMHHIGLGEYFAREVTRIDPVRLVTGPFLNFCSFRLHPRGMEDPEQLNALNRRFLEVLNSRGKVFLSHTIVRGLHTTRMVIGQTYVEKNDVDLALAEIRQVSAELAGAAPSQHPGFP